MCTPVGRSLGDGPWTLAAVLIAGADSSVGGKGAARRDPWLYVEIPAHSTSSPGHLSPAALKEPTGHRLTWSLDPARALAPPQGRKLPQRACCLSLAEVWGPRLRGQAWVPPGRPTQQHLGSGWSPVPDTDPSNPLGPRALTGARGRPGCTGNVPTGSRSGRCRSRRTRTRSPRRRCHCCTWSHTSERGEEASAETGKRPLSPQSPPRRAIGGGRLGAACLRRTQVAHRSPIQPALQRVHLPVTWLQACPSRHGGQRWPQPSP